MLFQGAENSVIFIIALILATILITLIIYVCVKGIESQNKASDKKFMILFVAFITVLILPVVSGALGQVLLAIGNILVEIRNAITPSGVNYLEALVPIIYFLMLLALIKFLIDTRWESALWISLLTLFIMYIIYTLVPELYNIGSLIG